jgi:hypothetical protein
MPEHLDNGHRVFLRFAAEARILPTQTMEKSCARFY